MGRSSVWILSLAIAVCALAPPASTAQQPPQTAPPRPGLDFEFFRSKVQPIFLARREGHARCIACHAGATASYRHEPWGLPAAFVEAGARAVIASPDIISDADAGAFFDAVRAQIERGGSPA